MSRLVILILFILLLAGGAYYLSTVPEKVPTKTIETDVEQGANAS